MAEPLVRKAPLVWWIGGLLLGLTQILAVAARGPLGVSTQFVVANAVILHEVAPEYAAGHPMIASQRYRTFGYGWYLDIGIIVGAAVAAFAIRRWRPIVTPSWWKANYPNRPLLRLVVGLVGGFVLLMGARIARGCTSGQFLSGWSQLSLSVVPFTIGMFGLAFLTAWVIYRKAPHIERD